MELQEYTLTYMEKRPGDRERFVAVEFEAQDDQMAFEIAVEYVENLLSNEKERIKISMIKVSVPILDIVIYDDEELEETEVIEEVAAEEKDDDLKDFC
jgi:hypothetical protein